MLTTDITSPAGELFVGTAAFCKGGIDLETVNENYSVQMDVNIDSLSDTTAFIGAVVRLDTENPGNYYTAFIRADGVFAIARSDAGVLTILEQDTFTIEVDTDYKITLRIVDSIITAQLSQILQIEATDGTYPDPGCPGFVLSRADTSVNFNILDYAFYNDIQFCNVNFEITDTMIFTETVSSLNVEKFVNIVEGFDGISDTETQVAATLVAETEGFSGISDTETQVAATLVAETEGFSGVSDTETAIVTTVVSDTEPFSGISETETQIATTLVNDTEPISGLSEAESVEVPDNIHTETEDFDIIQDAETVQFHDVSVTAIESLRLPESVVIGVDVSASHGLGITDNANLERTIGEGFGISESVAIDSDNTPKDSLILNDSVSISVEIVDINSGFQEPDVLFLVSKDRYF